MHCLVATYVEQVMYCPVECAHLSLLATMV